MSNSQEKTNQAERLHKYSPLFILIHVVLKSIIPLAFGLYQADRWDFGVYIFGGIGVFMLAIAILQYWFYNYWLSDERIEIKEGILFKKNRKIPYTRIQNVNVSQNPLERIFNVATLQLESASGGKPEAIMRVVSLDVVEQIKSLVKKASTNHANVQSDPVIDNNSENSEHTTQLLELSTKEVIKYGIISQKGLFIAAILFSFMSQNQALVAWLFKYLNAIYQVPDFTKVTLSQSLIYVAVIGSIIFIVLQLLSIVWALLKFYQFEIHKNEDRLQATMGLLSKVSATIPLKKIQLYRISENPIHKYFKARTITIETAGGVNTDKAGIVMRWLAPYINTTKVKDFVQSIEPKIKLGNVDWQLIPQRAWKRVIKKSLISVVLFTLLGYTITSLPYFELKKYTWIIPILLIPISYFYAKNYVKKTAYYINDDIICFKSGVWFGKQSFVKISKIQTIEIQQSYFDRRNKMATLEIDTAGSNPLLHHVKIPYLEVADAYKIRQFIQDKIKATEFNW
jgi:putative membrane protein